MPELNFFDSMQYLEPRCPKCDSKIDYGITTEYNEKKKVHVCIKCGEVLK